MSDTARMLHLWSELDRVPPVSGPCVACERKPARIGYVHVGERATSQVGLCDPCARLVGKYETARNQAYAVAALQAARGVAP